jgi:mannose-1-phosphate guanylyltransferase/mannose-6-phosphate isomerase
MIIPVILCGGVGTRLWPLSRKTNPKQFISIMADHESLFDKTLKRIKSKAFGKPIIVCNEDYEFKVRDALNKFKIAPKAIILEPQGRNTVSAIALAAFYAEKFNIRDNFLILPADHYIQNEQKFIKIIHQLNEVKFDKLVTFGIKPTSPSTAYGYIKKGKRTKEKHLFLVDKFVEKPNLKLARQYINSGNFYWNSGIFLFNPKIFLNELKKFEKNTYNNVEKSISLSQNIGVLCKPEAGSFLASKDVSIDYAILEKSKEVLIYPMEIDWSDVGSWDSIYKVGKKDKKNNSFIGDVVSIYSNNNFVYSVDKLTALIDVKDLIIVSTKDAVLVAKKSSSEKVKEIVEQLKKSKRKEYSDHIRVYRPWGYYENIDYGNGFKTKKIVVNPKGKLSLQKHNHRSEHWVVVSGVATVTNDNKIYEVPAGESTFIPKSTKHRLENKTNNPLEIIEIQIGGYLEEDDIIRYDDIYGRIV